MSASLSPEVLKARLIIALSLFEADGFANFMAWAKAEGVSDHHGDVMLVEAILQALGEEYSCVSPLLVMTFRDRLTEAFDGLV